jgi:hypothetical protein
MGVVSSRPLVEGAVFAENARLREDEALAYVATPSLEMLALMTDPSAFVDDRGRRLVDLESCFGEAYGSPFPDRRGTLVTTFLHRLAVDLLGAPCTTHITSDRS